MEALPGQPTSALCQQDMEGGESPGPHPSVKARAAQTLQANSQSEWQQKLLALSEKQGEFHEVQHTQESKTFALTSSTSSCC